jgi:hypothetical protein
MGLKEALAASTRQRPGYRCGVCKLLDDLPKDDADALREALADPQVQGAQIARALHAEGIDVSQHSVQRHRRQDCQG